MVRMARFSLALCELHIMYVYPFELYIYLYMYIHIYMYIFIYVRLVSRSLSHILLSRVSCLLTLQHTAITATPCSTLQHTATQGLILAQPHAP